MKTLEKYKNSLCHTLKTWKIVSMYNSEAQGHKTVLLKSLREYYILNNGKVF